MKMAAAYVDDHVVKVCQQQIIKLDLQINAVIQDIQRCNGPIQTLEEQNLNVAYLVSELKQKLEDLERFAKEQDHETSKIQLMKDVSGYRIQLTSTLGSLRKANLMCQLRMEQREKDELLFGDSEVRHRPVKSKKEILVNTSSNVTESLLSLRRMMSGQVQQSEQTMGSLVSSSTQIGDTHEEFKNMGGHIQISRKLLTKYGRRECTDKLLIFLALIFFFVCVLYIIKKRMFGSSEDVFSMSVAQPPQLLQDSEQFTS